jgi:hypothetical protein
MTHASRTSARLHETSRARGPAALGRVTESSALALADHKQARAPAAGARQSLQLRLIDAAELGPRAAAQRRTVESIRASLAPRTPWRHLDSACGDPSAPLQLRLNPLDGDKPGRLPDNERTLKDLLAANGLALADRQKARSDPAHEADLNDRLQRVLAAEEKFEGKNLKPAQRRTLRDLLAFEYDGLVDRAGRYRDDADAAYSAELDATAQAIRKDHPAVDELYKGGAPWKTVLPSITPSARIAKWVTTPVFAEAVRARYKLLYKTGAPVAAALSANDQSALDGETEAVNRQLDLWKKKPCDAPGCNDNGTWGTSKTGAGGAFAVSQVNARVWTELKKWWQGKEGTYVTPSDTSNFSLKKHRDTQDLSPTFNYHIDVA